MKTVGAATAGAIAAGIVVTAIARRKKPTIMKTAEKLKDWMQARTSENRVKSIATAPAVKTLIKGIAQSVSQALEEKDTTSGSVSEGSQELRKGPTLAARIVRTATVGAITGGLIGSAIAQSKSPAISEKARKLKGWAKSTARSPFVKYLVEDVAQNVFASKSSNRATRSSRSVTGRSVRGGSVRVRTVRGRTVRVRTASGRSVSAPRMH